jgi:hypothetical protein
MSPLQSISPVCPFNLRCSTPGDFQEALKSGVVLCTLANKIKPGSVPAINNSKMAFVQRENIVAFCSAIRGMGMRENDLFVTQDLFEGSNMVIFKIYSFLHDLVHFYCSVIHVIHVTSAGVGTKLFVRPWRTIKENPDV